MRHSFLSPFQVFLLSFMIFFALFGVGFAEEELLIGKDFWDFICKSKRGYNIVLDEYKKNAHVIKHALNEIKKLYLKKV